MSVLARPMLLATPTCVGTYVRQQRTRAFSLTSDDAAAVMSLCMMPMVLSYTFLALLTHVVSTGTSEGPYKLIASFTTFCKCGHRFRESLPRERAQPPRAHTRTHRVHVHAAGVLLDGINEAKVRLAPGTVSGFPGDEAEPRYDTRR